MTWMVDIQIYSQHIHQQLVERKHIKDSFDLLAKFDIITWE